MSGHQGDQPTQVKKHCQGPRRFAGRRQGGARSCFEVPGLACRCQVSPSSVRSCSPYACSAKSRRSFTVTFDAAMVDPRFDGGSVRKACAFKSPRVDSWSSAWESRAATAWRDLAPRRKTWHHVARPGTATQDLAPRGKTWHRDAGPGAAPAGTPHVACVPRRRLSASSSH